MVVLHYILKHDINIEVDKYFVHFSMIYLSEEIMHVLCK